MYDFANILLAGPCNLSCRDCIGRKLPGWRGFNTLTCRQLPGLCSFIGKLKKQGVKQISITGLNTDPLLYPYLHDLLVRLRHFLPESEISLHTNGLLLHQSMLLVNSFDRITISIPSLVQETYRYMTGRKTLPDFEKMVLMVTKPLKISILVTSHNRREIPLMLQWCQRMDIKRVVLRYRCGDEGDWQFFPGEKPISFYGLNPVYSIGGLNITIWRFTHTALNCLNLYPDGSIKNKYLLEEKNGPLNYRNRAPSHQSKNANCCLSRNI